MNRILINTFCALLLITTAHAQSVGIGTNQPDASAALDVTSANKGFLIPRINMAANPVAAPAAGLMVFNTNSSALNGTGLYINMGTAIAPKWVRVASSGSDDFIRNQTSTQQNSNFHISNDGVIDGSLSVGSNNSNAFPLLVNSLNNSYTAFALSNSSSNGIWMIAVNGASRAVPGSLQLTNFNTGRTALLTTGDKVGINMTTAPTATLDVNGDIKASGNFIIDMKTVRHDYTINGHSWQSQSLSCPTGYRLVSGGGGHRDANGAISDIRLAYNGPHPERSTTTWRIMADNVSGSSRAMVIFCTCARVQ